MKKSYCFFVLLLSCLLFVACGDNEEDGPDNPGGGNNSTTYEKYSFIKGAYLPGFEGTFKFYLSTGPTVSPNSTFPMQYEGSGTVILVEIISPSFDNNMPAYCKYPIVDERVDASTTPPCTLMGYLMEVLTISEPLYSRVITVDNGTQTAVDYIVSGDIEFSEKGLELNVVTGKGKNYRVISTGPFSFPDASDPW